MVCAARDSAGAAACYRGRVPLLRALVLAVVLGHATGLAGALERLCAGDCADDCGERDRGCDDGTCPPVCASCQCARAPTMIATVPAAIVAPLPIAVRATHGADAAPPASPDPREILHVPIVAAG